MQIGKSFSPCANSSIISVTSLPPSPPPLSPPLPLLPICLFQRINLSLFLSPTKNRQVAVAAERGKPVGGSYFSLATVWPFLVGRRFRMAHATRERQKERDREGEEGEAGDQDITIKRLISCAFLRNLIMCEISARQCFKQSEKGKGGGKGEGGGALAAGIIRYPQCRK